ncbi:TPA: transcriptional regulator [Pseudomonas aeruginosa]
MDLIDYIKRLDAAELSDLATRCETSSGQIKQVAYGHRRASATLAINLDRETDGKVTCEKLRPDIDWGYLRSNPSTNKSAA